MKIKIKERLIFLINERHAGVKKGMADALGIQSASISDWTKDIPKCAPADEHVNKICEYYHVSKSWLLGLSDEMHQENKPTNESIRFSKQEMSNSEISIHTAKIEQLLDRSQDFLDRYLKLVEQQQGIIDNLSQTLNRVANNNVL